MVLGSKLIRELELVKPFKEENLQPASYDLSIGEIKKQIDGILLPNESVLISTKERVELPNNVAAFIKSRSSLARVGVSSDFGGWIDPGYRGNITLYVKNLSNRPMKISEVDRFTQIIFLEVKGVEEGYNGNYQDSNGIAESVLID